MHADHNHHDVSISIVLTSYSKKMVQVNWSIVSNKPIYQGITLGFICFTNNYKGSCQVKFTAHNMRILIAFAHVLIAHCDSQVI